MKKFRVIREANPTTFEEKMATIVEDGKYTIVNSGADGALGWWAYLVLKEE